MLRDVALFTPDQAPDAPPKPAPPITKPSLRIASRRKQIVTSGYWREIKTPERAGQGRLT
jgi:hypothetical protein